MDIRAGRRQFLTAALGGVASAAVADIAFSQEKSSAKRADEAPERREPPPGSNDSIFLTWQGDPTTTMTIQWIGPEEESLAKVLYGKVGAAEADWQTAAPRLKDFPDTIYRVHRCELTGLEPGAEYQFRVGEGSVRRFRTMPAKATDTLQWVSGGDAGTGSHAVATNLLAARQEPHFCLIGGDLAYDNGVSPTTFLRFVRNYSQQMIDPKGRMVPLVSCIGNHEVAGGYKGTRAKAPHYLSVFDGFFPEKTYGVLDFGDYMSLVLLDTGHIAKMAGEQTDWLEQTLKDRQDRPHLIVANHVPAYPSHRPYAHDTNAGTGADNRKYWSPLFEKYKVDVVLEHHDHTFKRTFPMMDGMINKNGIVYLGDGSWGKLRPVKSPEKRPYLQAYSSSYHCSVHRLEGDQRFHIALEESGKIADVCMTVSKRPSRRG